MLVNILFFLYIYINMCSKQLGCSFKNNQMIKILKLWKYFNTIKTSRIWLDQTMQFQYKHLSKNTYCTKNQIGAWVVVVIIIPKGALFAVVRVKITPQTCNQRDTKEWKEEKKKSPYLTNQFQTNSSVTSHKLYVWLTNYVLVPTCINNKKII